VCTCAYADAERFPAAVIVEYLMRGLTREPVRRAVQGADDVAARLIAGIGEVRLRQALAGLSRNGRNGRNGRDERDGGAEDDESDASELGDARGGVDLRIADGSTMRVDHAVLATQANQALALLGDGASAAERRVLAGFTYRPVEVVMHTDARLLPARRRDWSAVNLLVTPGQAQPQSTIWVNAVQPALATSAGAAPIFQTVHPLTAPRDETVLAWSRFERPLVDAGSERALAGLAALHAERGRCIWFCGSYAQPGIPLLESAVRSAEQVVSSLAAALSGPSRARAAASQARAPMSA
jgi:predicted NAD/FAD-binding protein